MIATHKGEIPFVILLLPFLSGIGAGLYFTSFILSLYLTTAFVAFGLGFILLNISYSSFQLYRFKWIGGLLIHVLLLLLGWLCVTGYNELNNSRHFSKTHAAYLVVQINNEPKLSNGLLRFTATVEEGIVKNSKIPTNGTLLVTIKDSASKNLYYGDELLIPANYTAVDPPFNPGEFNYKSYLANQNIFYQSFLYSGQYVLLNSNAGNPLIAYSLRLRQRLVEKLKSNMHNPEAIAVASTLILGYKADMSKEVLQAYSKTGTIHVLSVSGAHVAIIFILLNLLLGFMDKYHYGKIIKAVVIILLIWYYSLLSGFSPAVCRAAVMISMIIIGKTYNRYINTLNILAASAFVLLLYDPFLITDVGFQLSYLAVAGLIVLQPVVYKLIGIKNKWADKLWALCSVSIAAQVITFPLSAFYFHQFPVYFLVSNLFIIVPTAVIMYTGIGYLLLPQIPFISKALAYILETSILLMNKTLAFIEHSPYAGINKIWINTPEYLLIYGIIMLIFYFLYQRKVWLLKTALCLTLLLSISISYKKWDSIRSDSITFLNLRKHTGIIFKHGDSAVVLCDMADTDKNYKYSVQPCLDSFKVGTTQLYTLQQGIKLPYLQKTSNLLQFGDKTILLFDRHLQKANTAPKLKIDYIYLTGNPHTDINFINSNYQYKYLIASADNTDAFIRKLQDDNKTTRPDYKILKRNISLTLVSN